MTMCKCLTVVLVCGLMLGSASVLRAAEAAPATAPASQALGKAIYTEETAGDLDAAMKLYQQIAEQAQAERPAVAEALLRLGNCQLKKGRQAEAIAQFRKVLADFADQAPVAQRARQQLAKLGASAGNAPVVLSTSPATLDNNVPATLDKISVRFDRTMFGHGWSFCQEAGRTFPETPGNEKISFDSAGITCTMPVKLKPGTVYWTQLNMPGYTGFRSANGVPARTYEILFATKSADGKPTPLPAELVKEVKEVNAGVFAEPNRGNAKAQAMVESISALMGGAFKAMDQGDSSTALTLLRQEIAQTRELQEMVRGSAAEAPIKAGLPMIESIEAALAKNDIPQAKKLMETLRAMGPDLQRSMEQALSGPGGEPATNSATRPALEPLKLTAAPWQDGEEMDLRLRTQPGMEIGTLNYHAHALKVGGRDIWRIEADQVVTVMADSIQYTRADADQTTFAPLNSVTRNERGTYASAYQTDSVDLTVTVAGQTSTHHIDLGGLAYDNEQALYLIRRLPLGPGYHAAFAIFPPQSGAAGITCKIEVTGRENIKVAAGEFDCHKVQLQVVAAGAVALTHQLWFSADEHRYLVKYDAGTATMELTSTGLRPPEQAQVARDEAFDLALPVTWDSYKPAEPSRSGVILQLIAPQRQAWAALCSTARTAALASARNVAEADIKTLAGYFKGYFVRPESWSQATVSGLPSVSYSADYQDKDQAMVEYRTYVLGPSTVYWFMFRVEKDQFEKLHPSFDAVVSGFKVK